MACAIKRLAKEHQALQNPTNRVCELYAAPLEENIFVWHFTIQGPTNDDLGYAEGLYHGALIFPRTYPFAPPDIVFFTPSGRFETNVKICSTISSYHPERWQPTIDVSTILIALRLFMEQEGEIGNGGINSSNYTRRDKKEMARRSRNYACKECGRSMQEIWEKEMHPYPRISEEKETTAAGGSPQPASDGMPASDIVEKSKTADGIPQTSEPAGSKTDAQHNEDRGVFNSGDGSNDRILVDADKTSKDAEKGVESLANRSPTSSVSSAQILTEMGAIPPLSEPSKDRKTPSSSRDPEEVCSPAVDRLEDLNAEGNRSETCVSDSPTLPTVETSEARSATSPINPDPTSPVQHALNFVPDRGISQDVALVKDELTRHATPTPDDSGIDMEWMNYSDSHGSEDAVGATDNRMIGDEYDSECDVLPEVGNVLGAFETPFRNEFEQGRNASGENLQENSQPDKATTKTEETLEQHPILEVEIASVSVKISISFLDWLIKICAIVGGVYWLHRLCIFLFRYGFGNISV
ncbi:unnamed protein product [Phytomonas sp. EM1]|nr:unnamed protein product [Phytomonas sp. EM1]|eukprot:CCW61311.1 unnamed protein product [Phytomonas sp. isolate EM1]